MSADESKIRAHAYRIWDDEGRPDGRAGEHWQRALRELAALDTAGQPGDNPANLLTNPDDGGDTRRLAS